MEFLFAVGIVVFYWLVFRLYKSMGVWGALKERNKMMLGLDEPLTRQNQSYSVNVSETADKNKERHMPDHLFQQLTLEDVTSYAVGGTARFVGAAYNNELKNGKVKPELCRSLPQLTKETYEIVKSALLARFQGDFNHQDFKSIILVLADLRAKSWSGEGSLDDVPYGLLNLVESILTVEAGYDKSSASDLETFRFIIVAELAKSGVPEKYILGRINL